MEKRACPFCRMIDDGTIVSAKGSVFAVQDKYPVTEGHLLILPKRHTPDFFSMTKEEHDDARALIRELSETLRGEDGRITGFNIGMNCGEVAGQTVMHAHIHLIPRREGDARNPRGGVRGVIPGKRDYGEL